MRDGTEWDGMNNGCSFMVMVGGGIAAVGVYDFPHCTTCQNQPDMRLNLIFSEIQKVLENRL